eukprot:55033-Eustigmatos_ZCMA.PRE.2
MVVVGDGIMASWRSIWWVCCAVEAAHSIHRLCTLRFDDAVTDTQARSVVLHVRADHTHIMAAAHR